MWDRKGKKGADLWRWLPHSLGNELLDVKAVLRITRINPRMGIRNYIIFFDNTIYNGYSNKNYFFWNEVEIHGFKLKIGMTRNNNMQLDNMSKLFHKKLKNRHLRGATFRTECLPDSSGNLFSGMIWPIWVWKNIKIYSYPAMVAEWSKTLIFQI